MPTVADLIARKGGKVASVNADDAVFEAQNCWLMTDRREVLYPLGVDGLSRHYREVFRELPPAYERARDAVFEHSTTLGAGQRRRGLLVYRRFKPKTKRFRVELQLALGSGDIVRLAAPYRRAKKKELSDP